ncbi:hypothetical protein REPUB_Repub02eG0175600 [Reevesia pubescens]
MLWTKKISFEILSFSVSHVDGFMNKGSNLWRFTGIYGQPRTEKHKETWELLRRLHGVLVRGEALPWLMAGDFNELLAINEKDEGSLRPNWHIKDFKRVIEDYGLMVVLFIGTRITWRKGDRENMIMEQLDRSLATSS